LLLLLLLFIIDNFDNIIFDSFFIERFLFELELLFFSKNETIESNFLVDVLVVVGMFFDIFFSFLFYTVIVYTVCHVQRFSKAEMRILSSLTNGHSKIIFYVPFYHVTISFSFCCCCCCKCQCNIYTGNNKNTMLLLFKIHGTSFTFFFLIY
jgi:hypothetical protein